MTDPFPSFFENRKSASPPAASAASAAREVREGDLQRMQQVQQPAMAEISHDGKLRAADAASAAGPEGQIGELAIVSVPSWRARSASLEHDAGLPHEWAEPLARLLCRAPPRGFEPHRWASVVEGASIFAEQWAAKACALGWSAENVFGLDEIAPAARHDRKGVGWLLPDGKRVVSLDAAGADIETARGVKQRFYRRNALMVDGFFAAV